MEEILKRIDDIVFSFDHTYYPTDTYKEKLFEIKQIILTTVGGDSDEFNSYKEIVGTKTDGSSACSYMKGVLKGLKAHLIWQRDNNKKYQIFISSTYKDLIPYRNAVADSIAFSNNIPAGMENFKASSKNPTEYIKNVIDNSDYYILILGQRYGSMQDEEKQISFTEMEYNYAKSQKKIIVPFIYNGEQALPNNDLDINKEKFLLFKKKISKDFMLGEFDSKESLRYQVLQAINDEIKNHPQKGWIRL